MNTDEKILQLVTKEDLNENLQYYADLIGLENLKLLMIYAGGGHIYIPQPDTFKVAALKKYLTENRNNISNLHKVGRDFGVCSKVVGKVLNEVKIENPDQLTLPL